MPGDGRAAPLTSGAPMALALGVDEVRAFFPASLGLRVRQEAFAPGAPDATRKGALRPLHHGNLVMLLFS